jgi:predicted nucleic acid-binding protein
VIVVDTSVWVELLRDARGPHDRTLRRLLEEGTDVAVTEVVVMELLAGVRTPHRLAALRDRLLAFPLLRLRGLADYEQAAAIYRSCRRGGETVRSLADCLVAVPAIREDVELLASDEDFEAIARHTELRLYRG